jgi:Protein of unknown function (DUF4019)
MRRTSFFLALSGVFALLLCASANAQQSKAPEAKASPAKAPQAPQHNPAAEAAAVKSAQGWLTMIDSDKYAQSRDAASTLFKDHWPEDKWEKALGEARTALGKEVSRKLDATEYLKNPPGPPAGEYVLMRYQTAFEKRKSATETVIAMLEKDGRWRIAVYNIR